MQLYDLKLGIIRGIISEHAVAMGTVKNSFKLVTQLVDQRRSLSWLSHCKREKVMGNATMQGVVRCEMYIPRTRRPLMRIFVVVHSWEQCTIHGIKQPIPRIVHLQLLQL